MSDTSKIDPTGEDYDCFPSAELYRAIVMQLGGFDRIAVTRPSDGVDIATKQARIDQLRAWVSTLPDGLRLAYSSVLDDAESSLRDWQENEAFQARAAAIPLPLLPPEP